MPPPTRFGAVPAQPARHPRPGTGAVQPSCFGALFSSCLSSLFGRGGGQQLEDEEELVERRDSVQRRPSTRTVYVGQDDYAPLSDGDRACFGTITSCSAVYAMAPGGAAVVYHWPFTVWTSSSVTKMRKAMSEIGWSGKDDSFLIKVYTQDDSNNQELVRKQVEEFAANLRETFTNNVRTSIYPYNYILLMTADGEPVISF